eukprot:616627-Pelagomonas_calceolata.AAC.2
MRDLSNVPPQPGDVPPQPAEDTARRLAAKRAYRTAAGCIEIPLPEAQVRLVEQQQVSVPKEDMDNLYPRVNIRRLRWVGKDAWPGSRGLEWGCHSAEVMVLESQKMFRVLHGQHAQGPMGERKPADDSRDDDISWRGRGQASARRGEARVRCRTGEARTRKLGQGAVRGKARARCRRGEARARCRKGEARAR